MQPQPGAPCFYWRRAERTGRLWECGYHSAHLSECVQPVPLFGAGTQSTVLSWGNLHELTNFICIGGRDHHDPGYFNGGTQHYNFSDGSVPQEWISSFSLSRLQCAQGKEVSAILQSSTKAVANWIYIHRAVMNFRSFSVVGNRSFCFSPEKQSISRWSGHRNSLEKKGWK